MTPYAFTGNASIENDLLVDIGEISVQNLAAVRGRQYALGSINDFFGNVAGSSVDYVALTKAPKILYCYELNLNHILPPEEIQPTGREIFVSLMTIFSETVNRGLA